MDSTETFFTKLKRIRESKDISIKEIAESTKVNTKFLSAIESGNFDVLPTVYMRLFIRSYCEFLDIDAKKVLDDYEIFTVGSVKDKSIHVPETKNDFDDLLDENNIDVGQIPKSRIIKIAITLVIIISFFWLVSSITNNTDDIPTINNSNQNSEIELGQIIDEGDKIVDAEDEIQDIVQETIPALIQEQPKTSNSEPYNIDNFIRQFSAELPLPGPPPFTLAIETLKKHIYLFQWMTTQNIMIRKLKQVSMFKFYLVKMLILI